MPEDLRLLRSRRNIIFGMVQAADLDPNEFRWDEAEIGDWSHSKLISILRHVPTEGYCRFGPEYVEYSPGHTSRTHASKASPHNWDLYVMLVAQWLKYVKREHQPDLWELLRQDTKLLQPASSPDLPNDSFTEPEKQYIHNQLAGIKEHLISDHHLQPQQAEILEQRFSYLADSLNRFGKKDWLNFAMGTLVNIALGAAFSPTVAQDMIHRVMSAIGPLYESIMKIFGVNWLPAVKSSASKGQRSVCPPSISRNVFAVS